MREAQQAAAACWARVSVWHAIVIITLLRLLLGGVIGLGDAEAYYLAWARRPLAAGYLDHPPLIAWLIGGAIRLFQSEHPFFVRLPSALLFGGALALLARLAARVGGKPAQVVTLILATPFLHIGGFGANPDVPLAFAAAALLLSVWRGAAIATGLTLGFALLAKASAIVLLPAVFYGARRQRRMWLSLALGALVASPYLLWNATQGFPSLWFQLVQRGPQLQPLAGVGRFLGGQLGYVTPPLLFLFLRPLWRRAPLPTRTEGAVDPQRLLTGVAWAALALGLVACICYPSAEPHWTMPGYLALAVATTALPPLSRRWLTISVTIGCALIALAYLAILTPIVVRLMPERWYVARWDITNELYGWDEVGRAVGNRPTVAAHYTMCAQLEHASGGRPALCVGPRKSQYSLWLSPMAALTGSNVVFVRDERYPTPAAEFLQCRSIMREPDVVIRRGGRVVRRFLLERCEDLIGLRRFLL